MSLDSRFGRRISDEDIPDLVTRSERLQLVDFNPCHVALQSVQLQEQTHLHTQTHSSLFFIPFFTLVNNSLYN